MNSIETFLQQKSTGMRQAIPFIKMQALGNDFVLVHERDLAETAVSAGLMPNAPDRTQMSELALALAKPLCDRHFGIGADGLILARDPSVPDCQLSWLYVNSDASVAAMCGNGLRCLALYAVHTGLVQNNPRFFVETDIGAVPVIVDSDESITTDLGSPVLEPRRVPVLVDGVVGTVIRQAIKTASGSQFQMTAVSMGNPHCVIFLDVLPDEKFMLAAALEIQQDNSVFPEGVNVEFVYAPARDRAVVYVVERGCGPTLACATGAAAVQVAGVLENRLDRASTVELPGGSLRLHWSDKDDHVRITGPAKVSFEGLFDLLRYLPERSRLA